MTNEAADSMHAAMECTDWNVFFDSSCDIDEATDVITSYIKFCEDLCSSVKTKVFYPNNRPWVDREVRSLLREKQTALREQNRDTLRTVQTKLKAEIKRKKEMYRQRLESRFANKDSRGAWKTLETMTNYKPKKNTVQIDNARLFADELNIFYSRFDHQDFSAEQAREVNLTMNDEIKPVVISEDEVRKVLSRVSTRKATGPDGISNKTLKTLCDQLSLPLSKLFQLSINEHSIPKAWKTSCIIPTPKNKRPKEKNDFRPVALTSNVMKCFEKIILKKLKKETESHQDPFQFAYRANRGTEDAIATLVHHLCSHLDSPQTSARVLFIDFSSAFNTIQPHLMMKKLRKMNVSPSLILWVHNFLTNRQQYVKIGDIRSTVTTTNTGAPQGCVSSPILFSIYTSDCKPISEDSNDILVKYADDKCLVGLINRDNDRMYKLEVEALILWCEENYLNLNAKKTKEIVIDFRKAHKTPNPLTISGETVEQVPSYKYLGITITEKLNWNIQCDQLLRKSNQRLYFMKKLKSFNVQKDIMQLFHQSLLESVLSYSIIVWYQQLTAKHRQKLQHLIRRSERISGTELAPIDQIYLQHINRKAASIIKDSTHPLHAYFVRAKSGRRFLSMRSRTNRLANSFIPSSIRFLNTL